MNCGDEEESYLFLLQMTTRTEMKLEKQTGTRCIHTVKELGLDCSARGLLTD